MWFFLFLMLALAALIAALSYAGANYMQTPEQIGRDAAKKALKEAQPQMRAAIKAGVGSAVDSAVKEIVADLYEKSPQFRFIKYMQFELQRVDTTMSNKRAFRMAKQVLHDHLKDEGISFGDDRYAWDRGGAIDLIHAYEIDYWEAAG